MSRDKFLAIFLLIATGVAIAWLFSGLPIEDAGIAIDWKHIWSATHGFRGTFGESGLFNPPWILPLIWPFTAFPFAISWGLSAYATLAVLLSSVPKNKGKSYWISGAVLLAIAYPTLRQLVDGNLEAVVILGVLITLRASKNQNPPLLAAGVLLTAAKIQSSWLLLIALAIWLHREWPTRKILSGIVWAVALAFPFLLWRGGVWIDALINVPLGQLPSIVSSSLSASLARLGAPLLIVWIIWLTIFFFTLRSIFDKGWRLNLVTAGWLTSAGLLLSPYAASNSVLTPLALGVIPFLQKNPQRGIALFTLFNLPYLFLGHPELRANWESNYWTVVLVITWIVLRNTNSRSIAPVNS